MVTPASGGNREVQDAAMSAAGGIVVKKSLMDEQMFKDFLSVTQEVACSLLSACISFPGNASL